MNQVAYGSASASPMKDNIELQKTETLFTQSDWQARKGGKVSLNRLPVTFHNKWQGLCGLPTVISYRRLYGILQNIPLHNPLSSPMSFASERHVWE